MSGCFAGKFSVLIELLPRSSLIAVSLSQQTIVDNKLYTFNSQGKTVENATLDRWVNLINLYKSGMLQRFSVQRELILKLFVEFVSTYVYLKCGQIV